MHCRKICCAAFLGKSTDRHATHRPHPSAHFHSIGKQPQLLLPLCHFHPHHSLSFLFLPTREELPRPLHWSLSKTSPEHHRISSLASYSTQHRPLPLAWIKKLPQARHSHEPIETNDTQNGGWSCRQRAFLFRSSGR